MSEQAPSINSQPSNGDPQATSLPTRRVLVIDDDRDLCASVRNILGRQGFEVITAPTAADGTRLARQTHPDLVLCDYNLPDANGLEVLKTLRAEPVTTLLPFILITGTDDATVMRRGMSGGADDFLRKPINPEELITAIEARLKHHENHFDATTQKAAHRAHQQLSKMLIRLEEQTQTSRLQTSALEAAANGIVITDRTGHILWVNTAFTTLTGYRREEAIGQTPTVLKSGEHDPEFYKNLWHTVLSGQVWSGQMVNRRKDGTLYHEEMTITPVCDEQGVPQHFIAIKQDVTKRIKFEQELARERDLLQSLMDSLPDHIYFKDNRCQFVRINRALAEHFGLKTPEEAVGLSDADFFPPHMARQKQTDEVRLLAAGEPVIGLIERSETEGLEYWVSSTKVPLRDANGVITGLVGISRNITKFKQAEETLRQKTALMEAQLNSSIEGIKVIDRQGKILLQNQRCIDMWKIPAHIAACDDNEKHLAHVKQMVKYPKQFAEQVAYLSAHPDETSRNETELIDGTVLDRYSAPVLGKDGQNYGRIWAFLDITERKQTEQARLELEIQQRHGQKLESIGQLAAGIAHEINTPTQYIGDNTRFLADAFTELDALLELSEKLPAATPAMLPEMIQAFQAAAGKVDCAYLRGEIPRAIQQSLEGVNRVSKIVRAMKEFSHPGTSEKTAVDLNHAIEVTLSVSHNEWKYVADVKTEFDAQLPLVPCLPGEFNQVILNLVINAAHAIADVVGKTGSAKGLITISTRRNDGWAEIRIQDTGTGIPEAARPRMFEPFFTTKGVGKGTGQGLAIAHSVIVKKHGGTIHFETETGKGTTFVIRLPLTSLKPETKP